MEESRGFVVGWLLLLALALLTQAQECKEATPLHSTRASPPLCTFQSVAWFKVKSELEIQEMLSFVTDATNFTDPMYKGKVRLAKPGTDDVSLILTDVALNDSREYRCLRKWRCGGREKFRCDSVTLVVNEQSTSSTPVLVVPVNWLVAVMVVVVVVAVVVVAAAVVIVLIVYRFTRNRRASNQEASPPENEFTVHGAGPKGGRRRRPGAIAALGVIPPLQDAAS
ncbi:uncharacterized protein LOC133339728 isoform X2 [Lethenteron reissneri]|uniref:uncharacterized protein LOC133339728 isoform X2 n=1 Tax=Lethenteron reissneri TaxID=7753 RepID=UPI002AB71454|nr:uncharacterized protein LOC133339728 isoform X2 [Lethenteron reissneri]